MTAPGLGELAACPECGAPAEITEMVSQASTDGPVRHARVWWVDGHWFLMPSDRLIRVAAPRTSVA
ncbi:MAG: hypothetical protein J2P22_18045 [Nocardioides sp.]|nr:hypothetical protein [Nocardioides sp.]